MNNKFYFVYKTTNLINGKIYIGQHGQETLGFDGYLGSGKVIKQAINKYGKDNFIRETIEYCTSATIDEREIFWIEELSTTNKNIGYNLSFGGNSPMRGRQVSEESKRKMIKTKKRNMTEEIRRRMSEVQKGKRHSEDTKRRMSISHIGQIVSEETRLKLSEATKGHKHSEETKQKMSVIKKGNKNWLGKKHTEDSKKKMREAHRQYRDNKYD